jgi:hypothetical protein
MEMHKTGFVLSNTAMQWLYYSFELQTMAYDDDLSMLIQTSDPGFITINVNKAFHCAFLKHLAV